MRAIFRDIHRIECRGLDRKMQLALNGKRQIAATKHKLTIYHIVIVLYLTANCQQNSKVDLVITRLYTWPGSHLLIEHLPRWFQVSETVLFIWLRPVSFLWDLTAIIILRLLLIDYCYYYYYAK